MICFAMEASTGKFFSVVKRGFTRDFCHLKKTTTTNLKHLIVDMKIIDGICTYVVLVS